MPDVRVAAQSNWSLRQDARSVELLLDGELDRETVARFDRAVTRSLNRAMPEVLVVEAERVTFADRSILDWLVRTDRRMRSRGGSLGVIAGLGPLRDLLTATGLADRLTLLDG